MQAWIRSLLVAAYSLCAPVYAQDIPKKTRIQFLGEVQSVDLAHHTIAVKHVEIPGYAAQGRSEYSVEDESVLKRLQPGDDIRATVYQNDRTLYDIQVIYSRHKK